MLGLKHTHVAIYSLAFGVVSMVMLTTDSTFAQQCEFEEQQFIAPSDPDTVAYFGHAIALDGDVAVIGAYNDGLLEGNRKGAAYVVDRPDSKSEWTQRQKLVAADGMQGDQFGWAVAAGNDTILVGARLDDGGRGSVYVFDKPAGSWQQRQKITSPDPAAHDQFGYSVAINGNYAFIGARFDDHTGVNNAGAVYVYQRNGTTWQYVPPKLIATDPGADDGFGSTLESRYNFLFVGAKDDDVNGELDAGSVYVYDGSSGQWLPSTKITPINGVLGDQFGISISYDGDELAVGALTATGAVYIFSEKGGPWVQSHQLTGAANGDRFGESIALSGGRLAVGASWFDGAGNNSGNAYFFRRVFGTWQQVQNFAAADTVANDFFGFKVALQNDTLLVGALFHDNAGLQDSGKVYAFLCENVDTDGDGLPDDWEINGIPYLDSNGVERRLTLPGANPMRKNLYVELDAMSGLAFDPQAIDDVVEVFANAPVNNPDRSTGIDLTVDTSESTLPLEAWNLCTFERPNPVEINIAPCQFFATRQAHFGTPADRAARDAEGRLAAKRKAYRYGIVVLGEPCTRATGEVWANGMSDFWLFANEFQAKHDTLCLAASNPSYCRIVIQAAVFMHELGHTLGLQHGGGDDIMYKPHYVSIMNYLHVFPYRFTTNWRLDYSQEELDVLNEKQLNERAGVSSTLYTGSTSVYGCSGAGKEYMRLNGTPVDFDCDGNADDVSTTGDLNYWEFCIGGCPSPCPEHKCPSPDQPLRGHNDWAAIRYEVVVPSEPPMSCVCSGCDCDPCFDARGGEIPPPTCGFTWVEADEIWDDLDDPCPGDLNADKVVNTDDLFDLISGWDSFEGDITGDLHTDVFDLLALLAAWGPCE